jgi:two-component system, cell cycle sensor histidine kinase and response regulator CckA
METSKDASNFGYSPASPLADKDFSGAFPSTVEDVDLTPVSLATYRIVVADDDASTRLLGRYVLQQDGNSVTEAVDGQQVLEICHKEMPDLVLLDAVMPVVDGFEACRRLRRMPGGQKLIILMVTSLDDMEAVDNAFAAGANDFITKPIHWGVFRRRIGQLIQNAQTQERLHATEERIQALVRDASDGILACDANGTIKTCNPAAERLFGYSAAELIGRSILKLLPGSALEHTLCSGALFEASALRKNGTLPRVEMAVSEFEALGRKHYSLIVRDVTERKRSEEAVFLRDKAIAAIEQGLIITDAQQPDNPIIFVNAAFEKITGYSQAEALGKNCLFLQGPESDPLAVQRIRKTMEAKQSCNVELINYRKDGKSFWANLAFSPVRDSHGEVTNFVGVQTDITERKILECQLDQAQKMEVVGRLAGGIAHDFNNLLTAILGYSHVLLSSLDPKDLNRAPVEEIKKAGERAASLTQQLLAFSRRQILQPRLLDPNRIVLDVQKMLQRLIGEDIELISRPGSDIGRIKVDPSQFEQVILNLAVNARDAMPSGGKLFLETANVDMNETQVQPYRGLKPGSYVVLTVRDTGCGMDEQTRARVFEPFFTTKEIGKGTGLGLSTVYGIVKQSDGYIAVESQINKGSTFRVYLPRAEAKPTTGATPALLSSDKRGEETVLLVEDEDSVRSLVCQVLKMSGYKVLEANNGADALDFSRQHIGKIDLLLTDMIMPQVGGRQLAEIMVIDRPGIKVIFMSGYVRPELDELLVPESTFSFLQKPFRPDALKQLVRQVLDKQPA